MLQGDVPCHLPTTRTLPESDSFNKKYKSVAQTYCPSDGGDIDPCVIIWNHWLSKNCPTESDRVFPANCHLDPRTKYNTPGSYQRRSVRSSPYFLSSLTTCDSQGTGFSYGPSTRRSMDNILVEPLLVWNKYSGEMWLTLVNHMDSGGLLCSSGSGSDRCEPWWDESRSYEVKFCEVRAKWELKLWHLHKQHIHVA
jgi:hypothetical protein